MRSVSTICKKVLFSFTVFFLCTFYLSAQTENSPYSRYGIGDILSPQNILSRGMGGVSAAYYDIQSVNFLNPASYSRLKLTTLDIGLGIDSRTIRSVNPPRKFSAASPNISYVQLGVPLNKKKNWGMNFGLRPLTRISYKIERNERLAGVDSMHTLFEGNGGSYEVYAGTGIGIKNFSVGINVGYLFGSKDYSTRRTFIPDSADVFYYRSNHETKANYGGIFLNAGVQYAIKMNKSTWLRLGAFGNMKHTLNATKDIIRETYTESESGRKQIDSVAIEKNLDGEVIYPSSYGFGFMIDKANKWMFGVDYTTSKWSDYRFFNEKDFVQNSWQLHVGGQIVPNSGDSKNYWSHVNYRAGFSVGKDYVVVDKDLPVWSFSLGAGLPMRKAAYTNQFTMINTSFEFGQRGNKDNLIRENFFRVSIGFTLSDVWFLKSKYQ
ncbi:MAG TPA: hypothetical protein VM012_03655 [Flavitalea sp.]|nr:hypothetical protein [Flavitalea sp.]